MMLVVELAVKGLRRGVALTKCRESAEWGRADIGCRMSEGKCAGA